MAAWNVSGLPGMDSWPSLRMNHQRVFEPWRAVSTQKGQVGCLGMIFCPVIYMYLEGQVSYFFKATLPLNPATIALNLGHLAFQVDL